MSKIAKLFRNGNSQAVRLPQEFRFKGKEVRVKRVGNALVLEPIAPSVEEWFAEIDSHGDTGVFPAGCRKQPMAPKRRIFK